MKHLIIELDHLNPDTLYETDQEQSHHLLHVLRVKTGDKFTICNGKGELAKAIVNKTTRNKCLLKSANSPINKIPPSSDPICLFFSLVKKKTIPQILRQAVETGVNFLYPLYTENCVLTPKVFSRKQERWEKIIKTAAQQSGRYYLPQLKPPLDFAQGMSKTTNFSNKLIFTTSSIDTISKLDPGKTAIFTGPEGGFTKKEVKTALKNNFATATLGKYILRADTAALAAIIKYQTLTNKP